MATTNCDESKGFKFNELVIKENLDALDRGLQPAAQGGIPTPRPTLGLATVDGEFAPAAFAEQSEMRLSSEVLWVNPI